MRPGHKSRAASVAIALVMSAIVLLVVVYDSRRAGPGDISRAHASLRAFQQGSTCVLCHGRNGHSMTDACLECHRAVGTQLQSQTGLHGQLDGATAQHCDSCHSDHHGAAFPLVNIRSFQLAGVPKPREYRHQGLNFVLTGTHSKLHCTACHRCASKKLLGDGESRFLGLSQHCTACHSDAHDGQFGAECAACHGQQQPFPNATGFAHTEAFALAGAHQNRACQACHQEGTPYGVAVELAGRKKPESSLRVRRCADCHESPHNVSFLTEIAAALTVTPGESCQHCHSCLHESFRGPHATMDAALHALTGFPLTLPHDQLRCQACHAGYATEKGDAREFRSCYPGRDANNCSSCHGDPHDGQFATGAFAGATCVDCHSV